MFKNLNKNIKLNVCFCLNTMFKYTHRNKTTKETKMEAIVSYCNAMSYHQPDTHFVYVGEIGKRSDEWILRTAARQINWNGSLTEKEMGPLEIIGYQPCVD